MSVAPIRQLKQGIGAIISYYDGSTLLGKKNVPSGNDVLHPSITMPTKTGYTFVGWATSNSEDDWVGILVATGQPMSLYAIYLANTLNVTSVAKYVSGTLSISRTATWNTSTGSTSFTLKTKSRYNTATCTAYASYPDAGTGALVVGSGTIDNQEITNGSATGGSSFSKSVTIGTGSHSLYIYVKSYGDYNQSGSVGVSSIVMSDPIAWT